MNKLKFYVLTSYNLHCLKRHLRISGMDKNDLHVIINTQDEEYKNEAYHYCIRSGIECTITESNGFPAKGKNSVLELFSQSDNDYAVMIDGDDFLTPHGVWYYKNVAALESPPDVLCLTNQLSITTHENQKIYPYDHEYHEKLKKEDPGPIDDQLIYTFFPKPHWQTQINEEKDEWARKWALYTFYYVNQKEILNRVVFLSKKAAKYRFDEELEVGEDSLHFFLLKDAHFRGELLMAQKDDQLPTYMYDQKLPGTLIRRKRKEVADNYSGEPWVKEMVLKVEQMKEAGKLHKSILPVFEMSFPDNYQPDIYGYEPPDLRVVINKYI